MMRSQNATTKSKEPVKDKPGKPASVHEDDVVGKVFDRRVYGRLLPFAAPYRRWFCLSVFLLLILAGLGMVMPLYLRRAIDDFLSDKTAIGDISARLDGLSSTALILIGAGLITFVVRYAQIWITNMVGQKIIYDVRQAVFRHIQSRGLRFFDTNPVGRLVTRSTGDVESLVELFSSGLDVICYDLVMIGLILGVLFWIDVHLAMWTLALVPLVLLWSFIFKKDAQTKFRAVRACVTRLNSYINECLTGLRVIQIFGTEPRVRRRFDEWNHELRVAHLGTVRNFALFFPGVEFLSSLGTATILLVGHHYVVNHSLSVGDMMAFWFLLHRFFEPLREISEKYNVLQSAVAAAERIFKILDTKESIVDTPTPRPLPIRGGTAALNFDHVVFSYDGKTPILKDVSFSVAAGEKIAIVGPTGAGKSSLINVLSRFYDVSSGSVSIEGVDIREFDKHELRRAVGVVLQDVFLFADSIRENLRLGNTSFTDDRLWSAAETVYADRFIRSLPGQLDFEVQERGATFSLGQKQLLAFARTLVHDPPILVLDEATANIDTETERLIQKALDRLMQHRTVLVIAHRLSTIKKADRIIVLHHGEIRETGTHAELLQQDGIYRRLYEVQYKSQESTPEPAP